MSRTRATTLALVNWKGVFFERYLLDPQVTALEGANGAGKTTVMIAAYLVLLPDLSRLRFTNLGETGATGGDRGIFGRLGTDGGPSYAALELELEGERVILCIHLERKAEPSVQLTASVVHGLSTEHGLSALLLLSDGDRQRVPELSELKVRATELGARLEVFDGVRDYFTALFERGIVPLRLANDDERGKFNEMLRTSMTGGISRALTSELRTFLLREESGLSDTLTRMRANLDACRRTRAEVQESRALEREISGVYEAAASMFTAALASLQADVSEAARNRDAALEQEGSARFALAGSETELADGLRREAAARDRLSEARARLDAAKTRREELERALELAQRCASYQAELEDAQSAALAAKGELERAEQTRELAKREHSRARDTYDQAARGLANLQSGLEQLHRRAHAFRLGHAALAEARALLSLPELAEAELEPALASAERELERIDGERARRERELASGQQRREDYSRARAALCAIVQISPDHELYALARSELARLAELVPRAKDLQRLGPLLDRARSRAARIAAIHARIEAVGIVASPADAAREVERTAALIAQELHQTEEQARELSTERRALEERAARLAEQLVTARHEAERWQHQRANAERLASLLGVKPSLDELRAGKDRLLAQRELLRSRAFAEAARREALLAEAARFEREGGAFDPRLTQLCEELGGELFATRYEEIDAQRAAHVQAELGPLASAIVVEDLQEALAKLENSELPLDDLLLLRAGDEVSAAPGDLVGEHLLSVSTQYGLRVSRIPERPKLGRTARESRRLALLAEAEQAALNLEHTATELRRTEAHVSGVDELLREGWLAFGPEGGASISVLEAEIAESRSVAESLRTRALARLAQAGELRQRSEALRPLLAELHHLAPAHEQSVEQLEDELAEARAAEGELSRTGSARKTLQEWVEALRVEPPSPTELERFEQERAEIDDERDRCFRSIQALRTAIETRAARSYSGAAESLDESTRLVPALESELQSLAALVTQADAELDRCENARQRLMNSFQELDARRAAIAAHSQLAQTELSRLAPDFVPQLLDRAVALVAAEAERVRQHEAEASAISEELGALREKKQQAKLALEQRSKAVALGESAITPLEQRRLSLLEAAENVGLPPASGLELAPRLAETRGRRPAISLEAATSRELRSEARSRAEMLCDRLLRARGGQSLAAELSQRFASGGDLTAAHVTSWKDVRDWLARRLPAQIAAVPDPLDALDRLRDHLALLDERLTRHEFDLRGASEDVARGIEAKLRRAATQVRRLNQHLNGISFGSVAAIRVRLRRIERMTQILDALREGRAQELLFQTALPVEEALDEIFRRYGGGKGNGQRLLDYREYLDLEVEVERRAKAGFESVSPTRLSTGEAIGVGAALMMVILAEWERDASLFRNRRAEGTLRFLFLDEANRLSHDNLGVLFDLCKQLELQLLIAAPEVSRTNGNTTYRLVRQVNADGSEEVIVTGRRAAKAETYGASEPERQLDAPEGAS